MTALFAEVECGVPFAERFAALRARLEEQFAEGRRLEEEIATTLHMIDLTLEN
jgi:hypothetical protein